MPVWEKSPDVEPSELGMTNYEGFYDASLYTPRYPAWEMMEKETVKAFAITFT